MRVRAPASLAEFGACPTADGIPPLALANLVSLAADQHLVVEDGSIVVARCALWWRNVPDMPGEQPGLIGAYAATSAAAANLLLADACARLEARGCTLAVGPMDGSTWRSYRWITDRGNEPPFFLEPQHPLEWPGQWRDAGFAALATYHSSVVEDLGRRDEELRRASARLRAQGVSLRMLDAGRWANELARVHALSLASFARNFLYTPLPRDEFLAQYEPLRPVLLPELAWLAEHDGELVGFLFALPDHLERTRGEPARSVIMKTVAVARGRAYAGLGALLGERVQEAATDLGYTRAIHALMHDRNTSAVRSRRNARVIRRYTLFARRLRTA